MATRWGRAHSGAAFAGVGRDVWPALRRQVKERALRPLLAVLLGLLDVAAAGFAGIVLFSEHLLPLFEGSDQMGNGIAGTPMLVFVLPLLALAGAVTGDVVQRRFARRARGDLR